MRSGLRLERQIVTIAGGRQVAIHLSYFWFKESVFITEIWITVRIVWMHSLENDALNSLHGKSKLFNFPCA